MGSRIVVAQGSDGHSVVRWRYPSWARNLTKPQLSVSEHDLGGPDFLNGLAEKRSSLFVDHQKVESPGTQGVRVCVASGTWVFGFCFIFSQP